MSESEEACCLPGDVTVTQVHSGWMLGRALEQFGPGPWWSYVAIVKDFDTAIHQARVLARIHAVRAWYHQATDTFRVIPLDESAFAK